MSDFSAFDDFSFSFDTTCDDYCTEHSCFNPRDYLDVNIILPVNVMASIMNFVDLKTLYRMVFSSKQFQELLQVRMVVRAALMKGGKTKLSFERLFKLIERNAIWAPSPTRLIRLACGVRCEICDVSQVSLIHDTYGLFVCKRCLAVNQAACEKSGRMYDRNKDAFNTVLDHPYVLCIKKGWRIVPDREAEAEIRRTALVGSQVTHENGRKLKVYDCKCIMWNKPMEDSFGEKHGPVICPKDVLRIITKFLNTATTKWDGLMTEYFQNLISGPPRVKRDRLSYLISFNGVIAQANESMLLKSFAASTASAKRVATKTKLAVDFVERIRFELDNPILADKLLNYTINRDYGDKNIDESCHQGPLIFRVEWMNNVMKKDICRTTVVTAQDVRALVQDIRNMAIRSPAEFV